VTDVPSPESVQTAKPAHSFSLNASQYLGPPTASAVPSYQADLTRERAKFLRDVAHCELDGSFRDTRRSVDLLLRRHDLQVGQHSVKHLEAIEPNLSLFGCGKV
jgi:hypothetical protein